MRRSLAVITTDPFPAPTFSESRIIVSTADGPGVFPEIHRQPANSAGRDWDSRQHNWSSLDLTEVIFEMDMFI